jgi:hypothetical protein
MEKLIILFFTLISIIGKSQIFDQIGINQTFGSNALDEGKQVFVYKGKTHVFGNSGALTVNGDVQTVIGNGDAFVMVYDSLGAHKATKYFGGGALDRIAKVISDDFGYWMILTSYSGIEGTRTIPQPCIGGPTNNDLYIVRLDKNLNQVKDYSFCPYYSGNYSTYWKNLRQGYFTDVAYNTNNKTFQFSLQMFSDSVVGTNVTPYYVAVLIKTDTTGAVITRHKVNKSKQESVNYTHLKMKYNRVLIESDSITMLLGARTETYTAYYSGSPYPAFKGFGSMIRLNTLTGKMKEYIYSSTYSESQIKDGVYRNGKLHIFLSDYPISGNTINYSTLYFSTVPTGYYVNRTAPAKAPNNMRDVWGVVLDSINKTPQSQYSIGTNSDTEINKVSLYENDIYLGLSTVGGVAFSKTSTNKGGYDYWLVRLNNNNLVQTDVSFGGSLDDNMNDFTINDGITIITGKSKSGNNFDKLGNTRDGSAYGDCWTVGLCRNPIVSFIGDNLFINPGELVTFTNSSKNASYFYWEFFDGSGYSNDRDAKHYYNTPGLFTVRLSALNLGSCFNSVMLTDYITVGNYIISVREFNKNPDLLIYPNPAVEEIYVNPRFHTMKYNITNAIGENVLGGELDQKVLVSSLINGIYTLTITNKDRVYTTKFIKQ